MRDKRLFMPKHRSARGAAAIAVALLGAMVFSLLGPAPPSTADSWPPNPNDPKTPTTVAADALPTVQIDGVAWYQIVVGNTVYVAGSFARARPAGAAAGQNTVVRNNILAYDLTTGVLRNAFNANLNAQAFALSAAPDGSRIYVGGDFTTVNGVARSRVAALDPNTGALVSSFQARADSSVRALAATSSTLYLGGAFSSVNSTSRGRLAAVRASDGALLSFNARADNGRVNALVLSPDQTRLVVGGAFTTLNGSDRPGYGLGAVSSSTGALLTWNANNVVRDAGKDSAILSLSSDGTNVYGTGYIYGTGGNLEGAFSANWSDTNIKWVEDCHGDSYGVYSSSSAVYVAGHPHYCLNLGGYPEMASGTAQRAVAFSRAATGTLTKDTRGYPSFTGQPAPTLQNWFPYLDQGSYTGQSQAAWAVTGSGAYVVFGGEFRNVNRKGQQGLVRFANRDVAPNQQGPQVSGTAIAPTLSSPTAGQVKVSWTTNFDNDNSNLTYSVYRDGSAAPVYQVTRASTFWQRPGLSYIDTGLTAGQHSYTIGARDPFGNSVTSPSASITIQGGGNSAPMASFTTSVSGRTISVDGSSSSDPDGTIASYAWSFGDGVTGSGAQTTHTYGADGTFTVTLQVTDNGGARSSSSASVTVGTVSATFARDAFERNVTSGWGSADQGGLWTLNGSASTFAVNGGAGVMVMARAGTGPSAYLAGPSSTSIDARSTVSLDRVGNAVGTFVGMTGRKVGTSEYRLKVKVAPNGSLTVYLVRLVGGAETTLQSSNVGGVYVSGQMLDLRLQATGTNPTTIRAKSWLGSTAEPAGWQLTVDDATASLQTAGSVGLFVYLSGSASNAPVTARFDDFSVSNP